MLSFLSRIQLKELFPTKWSAAIFVTYMALFVNQGILVKASQKGDNSYSYNVISVIVCSELLKLLISLGIYLRGHSFSQLLIDFQSGLKVCLLYLIPAFLYCLYNNLQFINLANYDPTTYFILLQFRNVITGICYEIVFKKRLSCTQWLSLALLSVGCMVKEFGRTSTTTLEYDAFLSYNLILIFVQILCSCFAGVYNEYLLKDLGSSVHILIQNVYMYVDSLVCNIFLLLLTSNSQTIFDVTFLRQPLVIAILVNGACAGIVTSFFLKSLNSILKSFAATLEIIFTAIICFFIFATPIDKFTVISIVLIFISVYIYSRTPVNNTVKKTSSEGEEEKLLES